MKAAVSIENLTFAYRGQETPALRSIRAEMAEGSFAVLMGRAGAGKSTLCTSLNGIIPNFFRGQYQGRVIVKGLEVAQHKVAEMSRIVGLVLQDFEPQLFSTNVELEMAFGPENMGLPRQEIGRRIERYLPFLGLEKFRRREPASLSGGQKQRLAISSILTMEPEVLVMDEPTTDLDPQGREEIQEIARRLRAEGRTLLIVDYDPDMAVEADQVWLLREGQIVAQGKAKEVFADGALLKDCGIKAPDMVELFQRMGWPGNPLTVKEGIALIEKNNLVARRKLNLPECPLSGSKGPFLIQVEGLHYVYPTYGIEALRGIDLAIREGEFVALLGQNGSGKTTLAKHFNGLLKPTSGRVLLQGKPTTEFPQQKISRLVGYVFQNPDHQIFCNTVYDEVAFGLRLHGEGSRTVSERVANALQTVGLEGYEKKVPFALSKGERQRVAVASVLALQPEVLVLDEPTTGLDYGQQKALMEMIRTLHRKGHTVIIITHSMEVAAEYAQRVVVMKEGSILLDGPTRSVFAEEDRLKEAALRPPPFLRLSNWLGARAITIQQMAEELRG